MTALLHALANLARLRWLGVAFCALAIVCKTANVNANAIASGTPHEQEKTRVGGFEQKWPLNVCANTLASAETHRGISTVRCESASAFSHAAEEAAIATPYAVEVQSASLEAEAALSEVESGATVYRTGEFGKSMAGESQYWSLQNPLSPGYAGNMGVPNVTPDFIMGGTLNPGASVITNEAMRLGANVGGGVQVVVSPGGVGGLWFYMP